VEQLAERTRSLKPELDQRQQALDSAAKDLQKVTNLRKEAAGSAQKLEELVQRLTEAVTGADKRASEVDTLSLQIEQRAGALRSVESRLDTFEDRLATWDPVEQGITRSLEQLSARQGIVESLQADLDRMFGLT